MRSLSPPGLKLLWLWYVLGALLLVLVAVVSLMPAPAVGVSDKLSHVLTYLILGAWFALLAANRRILAWTLLGLIGYGMLIEWLQGMTGYRYAEWGDVLANGAGTVAGSVLHFTPLRTLFRYIDNQIAGLWRG